MKTRDHIVPRSKRGVNVIAACSTCNWYKRDMGLGKFLASVWLAERCRVVLGCDAGAVPVSRRTLLEMEREAMRQRRASALDDLVAIDADLIGNE